MSTSSGSSAENFGLGERQKAATLKTLESGLLANINEARKASERKFTKKESESKAPGEEVKNTKKNKKISFKKFKKIKKKKFKKKKKKKNNFAKLIKRVKQKRGKYEALGEDSLFSIISKAYMREGLERLNEVSIDKSKLPTTNKKYLDTGIEDSFNSIE